MGFFSSLVASRKKDTIPAIVAEPSTEDKFPTQPNETGHEEPNDRSPSLCAGAAQDALDVMADMIGRSGASLGWFVEPPVSSADWTNEVITGVCIRSKYGSIRSWPSDHHGLRDFEDAVTSLRAKIAVKIHCKAVDVAMKNYITTSPCLTELYINADTRIQIVDTIPSLAYARKNQYAAFVRDESVLCVWADDVDNVISLAKQLEAALIAFLWSDEKDFLSSVPILFKMPESGVNLSSSLRVRTVTSSTSDLVPADVEDPEKTSALAEQKARPRVLISPVVAGLAFALTIILMSLGLRSLLIRYIYDRDARRFALISVLPLVALLGTFPCLTVVACVLQLIGPISQYHNNSAFYSAKPPSREVAYSLLPITVQMPVYKESLEEVIIPTIESLKQAITTFERQSGKVNVIVCDDGLQLVSEEERLRRIRYYTENNLAYVARPPHGKDGYQRRGRFKKAGNLNCCNTLSLRIEDIMEDARAAAQADHNVLSHQWSEWDERELYHSALSRSLEESEGRIWAAGDVRIGEIILLIDSDTRVPQDCFLDASLEMSQSRQVAIIQHVSGVMQVANHYFENGMAFFTNMLQLAISLVVANGDVAPFVGHNAFLRWRALQECMFTDPFDGVSRVWSEMHVSEDFQIALTLQAKGWTLRWANYSACQFQEGVSLTCEDELSRWQKYAWGCSEIVFNPLRNWPTHGPLTKLFRTFLRSPMPSHSKFSVLAYIFSYYAFAVAWCGTIMNFVLVGVFSLSDTFYSSSWTTFFTCILLFQGLNNVAICVLRYRLKLVSAGYTALQQIKWMPFFTIFFSGLSLSMSGPLACHLLGINMSWTSTTKEVHRSNFFLQVPRILKYFWFRLLLSVVAIAGMIISTTSLVPPSYRVDNLEVIVPMAVTYGGHFLWPFVLDPYFLTFSTGHSQSSLALEKGVSPW